ncbi:MAG: CPBP family intramembrane glutamic endopeptidase [Chthoniobacterales bacterium]
MKDAARLVAYFMATVLFGALAAPVLYWAVQWLIGHGWLTFLADRDFETFFHRALLLGALAFLWPLLRSLRIRNGRDLGMTPNAHRGRDVLAGVLTSAVPLLCFGVLLVVLGIYSLKSSLPFVGILGRALSAVVVPFIEEPLFRGLILGVLLRAGTPFFATFATSALFSIVHFLKAPENTSIEVTWSSGFASIAHAFYQFQQPLLVAAGFTTLFLLGWILADARIRTRSLWLPIGLHAGWIFASALFGKVTQREAEMLPWLGKNLLIGLAPLGVALVSWALLRIWLRHVETPKT